MSDLSKFVFSMTMLRETEDDLSSKVSTLQSRIENISSNIIISDIPIIQPILSITRSRKDLKKLAKALDRIADIIEILDSLEDKLKLVQTAKKDPNWFISSFGDFSSFGNVSSFDDFSPFEVSFSFLDDFSFLGDFSPFAIT